MSDALYPKALLRWAADAHGAGHLPAPDAKGSAHNPVCGDRVTVELSLTDNRIQALAHETKACVLTQASASILGQALAGATQADVTALQTGVRDMLENSAPPPLDGFAVFQGAVGFPVRHRCVLLPFDAVLSAFEASEASKPKSVAPER